MFKTHRPLVLGAPLHIPPVAGHSTAGRFLCLRKLAVPPVWLVSSATTSARQLSTRLGPGFVGVLLALLATFSLGACSDDHTPVSDGGVDVGGDARPDFDPAQAMLVTIPKGAALCSGFSEGRNWQQELAVVGQIQLAAPALLLPRVEGTTTVPHFVGALLHSPDRQRFTPIGTETQREVKRLGASWYYDYTIDLAGPLQPAKLTVTIKLNSSLTSYPPNISLHAEPTAALILTTSAELHLGSGAQKVVQRYSLCELGPPEETIDASTAGGDRLRLELNIGSSCFASGMTTCLHLTRAEVTLGQERQRITDSFRLVYAGNHHNWHDEYLILLDPPLGATAALLIEEPPPFSSGEQGELRYLDAALKVTRTEALNWRTSP